MKNFIGSCDFDERYSILGGMLAIDTITVDRYSRLTLTKEVKNNLHIEAGKLQRYISDIDHSEIRCSSIQSFLPIQMGTGLMLVRTVLLNIDLTPRIEPEISCL